MNPAHPHKKRILSGMRSTGKLHLGNYVGALANWVKLQDGGQYDCFFFIADWHALTTDYADTSRIKQNCIEVALDWIAAGLDPDQSTLFIQSHVPQHAELHLLFSMITPLGWLERVPTYKEQQDNLRDKDLNTYGFLGYPLLQSADILLYTPPKEAQLDWNECNLLVPVGEDQVAHIELTREVARKFNFHYKRVNPWAGIAGGTAAEAHHRFFVFEEPQPLLTPAAKLPGTDGRKMSKSYGNFILLSDTTEQVEEKLRGMVNDPARYVRENPGNPDVCPVGDLHKIFSGPETVSYISNGCRTASIGCVECKQLAADSINARLAPMRTRRSQYESDPAKIWERLRDGASKAEAQAEKTMKAVREAVGISREPSGFTSNVSKDPIVVGRPRFVPRQEIWHIPDRTERGDAIRTTWLQDHTDIKLTPLEHRTFATPGRKRIAMPTARETKTNHWYPRVRPKHYDVMVLLCWAKAADGTPGELLDFVVPRKLFETAWKLIPKKLKEYRLEVVRTGTQYSLNFGDLDFIGQASVDITHTLGNLDPIL